MKVYKGLSKEALVRLFNEQKEARKLDLLLHGPLLHDVFDPTFNKWRFYNDGTESGATVKENEDTNHTTPGLSADYQIQLRARIQENGAGSLGGATTDDYGLEYSLNAGAYTAVTASSTHVQADTGSSLTDGGATTNRLTAGAGSFVAGEQEAANGVVEDHQLTADNYTEHVWGLKLINSALSDGDTIDFRITLNGGAPGMTNSVTPRITVTKAAADQTVLPGAGSLALTGYAPTIDIPNLIRQTSQRAYVDSATTAVLLSPWAGENVNISVDVSGGNQPLHILTELDNPGNQAYSDVFVLAYSLNSAAYVKIGNATSVVRVNQTPLCTTANNALGLTSRLTVSSQTYHDGNYIKLDGPTNWSHNAGESWEYQLSVEIVAADVSNGDTIDFRVVYNTDGSALDSYVNTLRATIGADKTVAPSSGSMTLTGYAPTIVATDDKTAAPGAGSFALTGFAPTVDLQDDRLTSPGVGSFTLTGYAPTLTATDDKAASPGAGALSLTGYAPTLNRTDDHIVLPASGSVVLTGYAPTADISQDKIVQPVAGTFTLTGYAPTVVRTDDKTVSPAQGSISLTGYAPAVTSGGDKTASPGAGSFSLSGYAPAISRTDDHIVAPARGSLGLTGSTPVVLVTDDKTTSPGAGSLTINGAAPVLVLTTNHAISVPVGSVSLTGYAPTITGASDPVNISVPAGVLAMTGYAPSAVITGWTFIDKGNESWSDQSQGGESWVDVAKGNETWS